MGCGAVPAKALVLSGPRPRSGLPVAGQDSAGGRRSCCRLSGALTPRRQIARAQMSPARSGQGATVAADVVAAPSPRPSHRGAGLAGWYRHSVDGRQQPQAEPGPAGHECPAERPFGLCAAQAGGQRRHASRSRTRTRRPGPGRAEAATAGSAGLPRVGCQVRLVEGDSCRCARGPV